MLPEGRLQWERQKNHSRTQVDLFSVWEEMKTLRLSNSGPAPELWGVRIYLKRKTETKLRARHCSVSQSARVSAMAAMLHLVICSIKLNSGGVNNVAGEIFMITRFCYLCLFAAILFMEVSFGSRNIVTISFLTSNLSEKIN